MNRYFFVLCLFFLSVSIHAQTDCSVFFPFKKAVKMEYANYDKKGKLESTTENSIMEVRETAGDVTEAVVKTVVKDKRGREQYAGEYTVTCEGETLKVDVTTMLNPGMLKSFSGMEVSIDGDYLALPNQLEEGQELPDAVTKVSAGTNGISIINMEIEVKDRKVLGKTSVTTPAGTFDCFKLSHTTEVDMMITRSFSSVEYYAEGVGVVRSETINEDGEVVGYMELTRFVSP
jgi:hypothetical protein